VIDLAQVRRLTMRPGSGKLAVFELETAGGRTYCLAAHSKSDAQRWMNALNAARGETPSRSPGTRTTGPQDLLDTHLQLIVNSPLSQTQARGRAPPPGSNTHTAR
jgi:hypothetical protein